MARFSKRTLRMLSGGLAGSWTLATISDLFDNVGVELGDASVAREVSVQRRGLATQYVATLYLDHSTNIAKLVEIVKHRVFEMTHRSESEPLAAPVTGRPFDQIRRDISILDDRSQIVGSAQVEFVSGLLSSLPDASAIPDHLRRLSDSIESARNWLLAS